jgi:hypothetical protein
MDQMCESMDKNRIQRVSAGRAGNLPRSPYPSRVRSVDSAAVHRSRVPLLYSHLAAIGSGTTITAGDLLFEVLKERLGSWETRDAKKAVAAVFPQYYPDSAARMALLGEVALSIYPRQNLSIEEFHHKLQRVMPVANPGAVASEALTYFVQTGVVVQTEEIEFPLRPLLEFLYGYATALRLDSLPSTDLKYWRPISYAATTVRKLGLGVTATAAISGYVRRLVAEAHEVFAASFIVSELRDQPGAAAEFVKALREFVRKPLSARSAPGIAWTQAARAFADSIRLAGQAGFDWFFDEYLDPRYPFVHVGSMAVVDVFREWAALSIGDLSDHERQRLAQIPDPHIAGDSDQLHGIVARIAILMPEVFDVGIRVWFCAMNLADEAFADRAKDLIRAAANSDPDLVKSVLEQCVNTGFANHAAAVYLDLFPAKPPLAVIRGLIRLESGQADAAFSLDCSEDRLKSIGASAWRKLLNWYVFDVDSPLAARAAIKLFELGETRLTFIGEALLRGMHDGGYIPRAEETLKVLVQRQGESTLRWLARRIGDATEEMHGAHSGWWRILLEHLPSLSGDGPRLLADCVSGLGCFLLARNPEVRQGFVQLLNGSEGAHYQSALRARLTHPSVAVRHGAAMVLLLANPKMEAEALEVVVRAKSARNSGTWYEWERFCLTLRFGASALATLQSHLAEMPEPSAVFGLAILKRNGMPLSPEQRDKLLSGKIQYFIEDGQDSADGETAPGLLRIVRQPASAGRSVTQVAATLLEEHEAELSLADRARCAIFADVRWPTPEERLKAEWGRAFSEPAYGVEIQKAALEAVNQGFPEPLLYLLVKSSPEDSACWREVLWALVGADRGFHDLHYWEQGGRWVLEFLQRHPEYRKAIGGAAVNLLEDPQVRGGRFREPQHWLALIADECGALVAGRLEDVLRWQTIEKSATVALFARLGAPLPGHFRRGNASLPAIFAAPPKPAPLVAVSGLVDLVRESSAPHPFLCYQMEQCLVDNVELGEPALQSIAAQGNLGTLVAAALKIVSGERPAAAWLSRLLSWDIELVQRDPCLSRLVGVWRSCVDEAHVDPTWRHEYLAAVTPLLDGEHATVVRAASHILALRGELTSEELGKTLRACTENRHFSDHWRIIPQLSQWLSQRVSLNALVLLTIERGLAVLDSAEEPSGNSIRPYPGPLLLLPLVFFVYAKKVDLKSCRVFMRGLRESIAPQLTMQLPGIDPFIAVDPLLSQVPDELLDQVFALAEHEDDPTIRVLARILRRAVKVRTN